MVQIPLRRAHRLRAITLASPIKKLRPQPTERAPTAWHTNDEYKNAEASDEASPSSAVANASEHRVLPIPTYSLFKTNLDGGFWRVLDLQIPPIAWGDGIGTGPPR